LTEGLNTGRAVILTEELKTTLHMLEPFESWSNCTLEDAKNNLLKQGVRKYAPMDSKDLAKSSDMPSVGALYAEEFSHRGYWWWKSQEISYALRPRQSTLESFEKYRKKQGWDSEDVAVFQLRRTDKVRGCKAVYGNKVKCRAEAHAPKLRDFINEFNFRTREEEQRRKIVIVTDDERIKDEMRPYMLKYNFVDPDPAPKRLVDKGLKGGIFKERALKDAIDILSMSFGNPFIFTYSSGFGAVALQLKQTRENFCSNWSSLDWGKREWPPVGTIGAGGVRGVKLKIRHASRLCFVNCSSCQKDIGDVCEVFLSQPSGMQAPFTPVRSVCHC